MRTRFIIWTGLTICLSVIIGCSSTTLKASSKGHQFTGKPSKVYIIGFSHEQDTRQQFEDSVVKAFTDYGVTGLSSYQDLPTLDEISDEMIEKAVKETGADTLLLTVATGRSTISVADIIPPDTYEYALFARGQSSKTYPQPYYKRYGTLDYVPSRDKPYGIFRKTAFADYASFSNPNREVVLTPANKHETIIIGTYLFDTQTKELIWSAELEAKKSNTTDTLITDVIETVTADLKKQGLI